MCLGQKALRISRTPRTTRARIFANDIRIQTGTKTSIGDTTDHSEDDFGGCGWMDVPFVSSPAPRGVLMIRRFTIRILTSVASHKQTGVCYSGWWKQEKKKKKSSRRRTKCFKKRGRSGASFNLSLRFLLLCTAATLAWHWNGNERAISFRYFSFVPRFLSTTSSSSPSSFPFHLNTYQRAPLDETLKSIASKD